MKNGKLTLEEEELKTEPVVKSPALKDGLSDLRHSMEGCFATCVGTGGKGYVKVEFKTLIQAQDFYTELLRIEKDR